MRRVPDGPKPTCAALHVMRMSAMQRLRMLPEVFTAKDIEHRFGMTRGDAHGYASRWAAADLVRRAGPRAGVYYNLLKDPTAPDTRRMEALLRVTRGAVAIGATSLHAAHWTTQRPRRDEVAVLTGPGRRSHPEIDGILICPRPLRWFRAVAGALRADLGLKLVALDPAWALADAWARRERPAERARLGEGGRTAYNALHEPWPAEVDDLEEECLAQAKRQIEAAFTSLGVPRCSPRAAEFLEALGEFVEPDEDCSPDVGPAIVAAAARMGG